MNALFALWSNAGCALPTLWTAVVPATGLAYRHGPTVSIVCSAVLIIGAVILWFERERTTESAEPIPFGGEERLAA